MQTTNSDVELITHEQLKWARRNGIRQNPRATGTIDLAAALFTPLSQSVEDQFGSAPGSELRRMHSFRSSSALAVNMFLPWADDPTGVAVQLGGSGQYDSVAFEQPFGTGVSRDPHLDVVLTGGDTPVAVESKFVEPYDDKDRSVVQSAYLDEGSLWTGMDGLRTLAEQMDQRRIEFERLEAAQLVKHSLGLAKKYGSKGFRLVYLWYRHPGRRADQHQIELGQFESVVGDSINFIAMTYQQLFQWFVEHPEPMPGYIDYLRDRYFPGELSN